MKYLFLIFLLIQYINCLAQFNNTYCNAVFNSVLYGATNVIETENNFVFIGQKTSTTERNIFLYKINQYGDSILYKDYFDENKAYYTTKIIKRENDYLVFGSKVEEPGNSSSSNLYLSSFDFLFNLNWIKTYGGSMFDSGRDLLQNEDGTLLLCGSKSNTANNEDFYLIKTDAEGNILWEKTYGGIGEDVAHSIIPNLENNGYILSGFSDSFSSSYDLLIYSLNFEGDILWQKTKGGTLTDYAGKATKLSDKTYLFDINESNLLGDIVTAKLVKTSPEGNTIWMKQFSNLNGYASLDFTKPIELFDGTIILTGVFLNSAQKPIGRIIKLDPMGNIIWQRDYAVRADRSQYIYDIQATTDGGFVFCGSAFDSTNTQRAWVAKLDCFGCDGVLCDFGDSLCQTYDCTTKDFEADFISTTLSIDLQNNQEVVFTNNATQCTNREWILPDTTIYTTNSVSHTFTETGTYPVQLITYHGVCSDTSTVLVEVFNSASLNEQNASSKLALKIIPNPSFGSFSLKLNNNSKIQELNLLDNLGRKIETLNAKETKFELNLSKGVYFLEVITDVGRGLEKVVIE
jgi:hypothetical protein